VYGEHLRADRRRRAHNPAALPERNALARLVDSVLLLGIRRSIPPLVYRRWRT
jgi:hypothetical protein